MDYDTLLLETECSRHEARVEMAIAAETDLITTGEADGQKGGSPRFPEDPRYWSGYCDGARLHWIHQLDRFHLLPTEF